ncbi:MAG: hypothetical protein H0Z35_07840 [Thermoanaerobacteraceae bacterium]|nr:hypothetical protein [Thermoanaerobacteraceae bacterium]
MSEKKYIVPRNVRSRVEFFPGFGFKELAAVGMGGMVGFALQYIVGLLPLAFKLQSFIKIVVVTICVGVPYMLVKPDTAGNTLLQQLQAYRNWSGRRKKYLFKRSDGK